MDTVMLKEDTKTKLIKFQADLQKRVGERVDFDTAISFLIDQYLEKQKDWDKFEDFCRPIKGVSVEDLLDELTKGRREDEKKHSSNL